jgi:transposase
MLYAAVAVERAMKVQEVICRVLAGTLTWLQGADILGIHTRSLRRWRARYERDGVLGLYDGRRGQPSRRKAPIAEVQRILRLYRERYGPRDGHPGFNVRHFYHLARRDHGVTLSYTFVKLALHEAGLVRRGRTRGRHRRRREPRPCFGELLHLDGSRHAWLALCPTERQTLIAVLDDATKRLLYAQLWPGETTAAVMSALQTVFQTYGLPIALYTDRAGWAFYTPSAGGKVDLSRPTQLGRALTRLGIEHIPSYSPQGSGPGRAAQSHPARPAHQRAPRGGHHHGRGRQRLPARTLHRRLRHPVHLPAVGPGPGLCGARGRRSGPDPLS